MKRWRRTWYLALPAILGAAQIKRDDPGAVGVAAELSIEIVLHGQAARGSIEFGKPFELDVIRRWPKEATPEPWRDAALSPLIVKAQSLSRSDRDGQAVENRRFSAWTFRRGAVALQPEFGLAVAEGEEPRRVTAELCTILIDSSLPADDAGTVEAPAAPALQIIPVRRVLLRLLLLAAAAGAVTWLIRASVRLVRARALVPPGPRAELLTRVEDLARVAADTRAEQRAAAVTATGILRAAERLLAERDPKALDQSSGALESAYESLEAVKFAGRVLSPADREALIANLHRLATTVPERDAGRTPAATNATQVGSA